jgi:hypothetical protein
MGRPLFAVLVVLAAIGSGCRPQTLLEQLIDARQLAAEILVQFTKAADATNRAVMAGTAETAAAAVNEAQQATQDVQSHVDQLRPILKDLRYGKESELLDEFSTKFAEYRALDTRVQDMAVESTNLKAQRMSWGPAQDAADTFRDSLDAVGAGKGGSSPRVEALAATALSSIREIQALQAPHIAEPDEATMTLLEKRMAKAEATARAELKALASLTPPVDAARLAASSAALDRFIALNSEIIGLSRRNTSRR